MTPETGTAGRSVDQLLAAYAAAISEADRLGLFDRSVAVYEIARSCEAAAGYVQTRLQAPESATRLSEYGVALARDDRLGPLIAKGKVEIAKRVVALMVSGGLLAFIVQSARAVIALFTEVTQAGAMLASGISQLLLAGLLPGSILYVVIRGLAKSPDVVLGYRDVLKTALNGPAEAKRILAPVFEAERVLFGSTGASRPQCRLVHLLGPALAVFLLIPGVIVGTLIVALITAVL